MRRTGSASTLAFLLAVLVAVCPASAAVPAAADPRRARSPASRRSSSARPRSRGRCRRRWPPRHPYMAANGRSNIHDDAYMSGAYEFSGPLGRNMERLSTFQVAECASVTFDRQGRIVSICVGVDGPQPRDVRPAHAGPAGGAPAPAAPAGHDEPVQRLLRRRLLLPRQPRPRRDPHHQPPHLGGGRDAVCWAPASRSSATTTCSGVTAVDDKLFSALPDWSGRLWFISQQGVVGTIDPASGAVRTLDLGEQITNSFAVDESGGVYIVSDAALYRFDATPAACPAVTWREVYPNSGIHKPGQSGPGSGTTPDVMGSRLRGDRRQRRSDERRRLQARQAGEGVAARVRAAGVRAGSGRDGQLAADGRALDRGREQLRLLRA